MLLVIGIKYITASPEGKADIKGTAIAYLIGAVCIFAAVGILNGIKDIVEKQAQAKWGDGFLQTLRADLSKMFPTMKGFSYRNLKSMRQWYLFYNQQNIIGKQLVSQLEVSLFSVPWGHHLMIMQRCKDIQEAIFYVYKTIENHWSRSV